MPIVDKYFEPQELVPFFGTPSIERCLTSTSVQRVSELTLISELEGWTDLRTLPDLVSQMLND